MKSSITIFVSYNQHISRLCVRCWWQHSERHELMTPAKLRKRPCYIRDIFQIGHFQSSHPLEDVPIHGFLLELHFLCLGNFSCICEIFLSWLFIPSAYSSLKYYLRVCWILLVFSVRRDLKLHFYPCIIPLREGQGKKLKARSQVKI